MRVRLCRSKEGRKIKPAFCSDATRMAQTRSQAKVHDIEIELGNNARMKRRFLLRRFCMARGGKCATAQGVGEAREIKTATMSAKG